MKKFIYLVAFYFLVVGCASIPNTIHPYSEPLPVKIETVGIQNSLNEDNQIFAGKYEFPFIVRDIAVDTTEMKALVRIKKPKEKPTKVPSILVYYDLVAKKILWTKRSYAWNPVFLDNKVLIKTYGKLFALDKKTGELIWERAAGHIYYNHKRNIGITGLLTAFDLDTGKDIWKRDLESQFGSDEIVMENDTLIIAMDGLHAFDLGNGNGWDIDMSTGKKNEAAAAAKTVGLYALGALTGNVVVGRVKANEFSGMTSNVLICDDHIFFAAKENLVCVERETGKEIWRTNLPEKKSAKSILLEDGNNIVLANKSYCYKNKEFYRYGIPYIAKFDKLSGKQLFSEPIDTKSYIQDINLTENGYYVITENELLYFGFNGKLNARLDLSEKSVLYGNNLELLSGNYPFFKYFVHKGEAFIPLDNYRVDPHVPLVETENGVLILDVDLDIQQWIPKEQITYIKACCNQNTLHRCVKYDSLTKELNQLDWKINSGLTPMIHIKTLKRNYNQIKAENKDVLQDAYLVDRDGNAQGKIEIAEEISESADYIYFIDNNALVLIQKSAFN